MVIFHSCVKLPEGTLFHLAFLMAQSPHGTSPPPQSLPPLGDPLGAAQSQHHGLVSGADRTMWGWGWGGDGCGRDKFRGFEWKTSGKSMDFRNHGGVLIGNQWDFAVCVFFCYAILAFRFSSISFWDHGHPAFLRQKWCDFHLVQGVVLNDSGLLYADAEAVKSRFYWKFEFMLLYV